MGLTVAIYIELTAQPSASLAFRAAVLELREKRFLLTNTQFVLLYHRNPGN